MSSQHLNGFSAPPEGTMVAIDVEGTTVAVAVVDGELHAFGDVCTHAGCSLADGELDGHTVVCPCHFSRFDVRTGAVLQGPAASGVAAWSARLTDGTLQLEKQAAGCPAGAPPSSSSEVDLDIAAIIEREHVAFRRQFDALRGLSDAQQLSDAWTALLNQLEIHAAGEESILYPHLVGAAEEGAEDTERAVHDHNEIRDSLRAVDAEPVGSDAWWTAVQAAQEVNEQHLQEEERDVLPAFRRSVEGARREELGQQWVAFYDEHNEARGLSSDGTDPQDVVRQQVR